MFVNEALRLSTVKWVINDTKFRQITLSDSEQTESIWSGKGEFDFSHKPQVIFFRSELTKRLCDLWFGLTEAVIG